MTRLPLPFLAGLVLLLTALARPATAELTIDITSGRIEPLRIAIADFHGADSESARLGADIAGVVTSDLESSGLFTAIERAAFLQRPAEMLESVRFEDWRAINAPALVTGVVEGSGSSLRVSFRLWDVFAGQQVEGRVVSGDAGNWRRIAHIVADAVYKRLTGEEGYFDTRVAYIAESGPATRRIKRVAVMDQDGANNRYLTDGSSLVLTPRFSPNAQQIAYLSYESGQPRVYLMNVDSGARRLFGDFPGMTFAPRFSPDGGRLLFSMDQGGNSDVYVMDLGGGVRQLTDHPAIDTSPSFSPDGSQIVFNSNRGGSQQLYVMGADGSAARRISFGSGRYGTPAWSPRGDLIAFTKMDGGRFHIGVMRPDGSGERLLTESFLDEGPTWAPNGRVIMFFRQTPSSGAGSRVRLYSVDLTGYQLREIATPGDASDPAWSGLLP